MNAADIVPESENEFILRFTDSDQHFTLIVKEHILQGVLGYKVFIAEPESLAYFLDLPQPIEVRYNVESNTLAVTNMPEEIISGQQLSETICKAIEQHNL